MTRTRASARAAGTRFERLVAAHTVSLPITDPED